MNMKFSTFFSYLSICILIFSSCNSGYLDLKRDKKQVVASTLKDYQALLDNISVFNLNDETLLNLIGGEEYTVELDSWNLLTSATEKNGYIWNSTVYEGEPVLDWNRAYKGILYANTVIEGIKKIDPETNQIVTYNNVLGTAHFSRGMKLYRLLQTFSPPYKKEFSEEELGVPLKTTVDIQSASKFGTLEECYEVMLNDFKMALKFLPNEQVIKYRPNNSSALAMLSKIYLNIGNYEESFNYANLFLRKNSELLDYNTLSTTLRYTFSNFRDGANNPEVIYLSVVGPLPILRHPRSRISKELIDLYEEYDLRKYLYFYSANNELSFKGSYSGTVSLFTGIAVDEILLIRAECNLKLGRVAEAIDDINYLKSHRYDKRYFSKFNSGVEKDILSEIINERRRELVFRGIRWEDLRRYNTDTTLIVERKLGDIIYKLNPKNSKYLWPIPDDVIGIAGINRNLN